MTTHEFNSIQWTADTVVMAAGTNVMPDVIDFANKAIRSKYGWHRIEDIEVIRTEINIPEVLKMCEVDVNDLTRAGRNPLDRYIATSMIYLFSNLSLQKIGRIVHKDHSTIMHGFKVLEAEIFTKNHAVINKLQRVFDYLYTHVELTKNIQNRIERYEFAKHLKKSMHNPCLTDDPDDQCENCTCWKSTRANCS